MASSVTAITVQTALLSVVSSLLAQALTAHQKGTPLLPFDWIPVVQMFVYACLSTPPNVWWQLYLERRFPKPDGGSDGTPDGKPNGVSKAPPSPPPSGLRNTLVKTALDQTAGSAANQVLFCSYLGCWAAVAEAVPPHATATATATAVVASLRAVLPTLPAAAAARVQAGFWPMLTASWRFWPWISLGNFALLSDVGTRNLVGGLAGVAWGVYVSLFASAKEA